MVHLYIIPLKSISNIIINRIVSYGESVVLSGGKGIASFDFLLEAE